MSKLGAMILADMREWLDEGAGGHYFLSPGDVRAVLEDELQLTHYEVGAEMNIEEDEKAAAELVQLWAERDAWREYAPHQETCGACADYVGNCEIGSKLRAAVIKEPL